METEDWVVGRSLPKCRYLRDSTASALIACKLMYLACQNQPVGTHPLAADRDRYMILDDDDRSQDRHGGMLDRVGGKTNCASVARSRDVERYWQSYDGVCLSNVHKLEP